MNTRERKRLEKLILFLDNLEPERFDFNEVVVARDSKGCGTVCCAIGWTPAVFPRLVRWTSPPCASVQLKKDEFNTHFYYHTASVLFGLPGGVCKHLFCPSGQRRIHKSLPNCGMRSCPKEVAAMLRKFLELWDAGKINLNKRCIVDYNDFNEL